MSTDALDQLELDIKRLERDKRIEEIRQLRASGGRQWITPTALAALLPVLAGLGVWVVSEIKQYHEGYRALEERDRLAAEKAELQRQKDSLNIEVGTLLDLKGTTPSRPRICRRDSSKGKTSSTRPTPVPVSPTPKRVTPWDI